MAKKTKINLALLEGIVSGTITHVSKNEGLPLVEHDPALVEVNINMLDGAGNAAVRATAEGKAMVNGGLSETITTSDVGDLNQVLKQSTYSVLDGVALPPAKKRGNKSGGAPVQYPFDTLEIGQSFFVPVSEKHPDPLKTLGSAVSNANMRYAVDTGETKVVTRTKRDKSNRNRAIADAEGNKVKETVTVPVYKRTRQFTIRAVENGVVYGNWTAPANGVVIGRVDLKD